MEGFLKISRFAGMREDLVQASGGNSSFKETAERMFIKASGVRLVDVTEKGGYGVVNPQVIREAFEDIEKSKRMSRTREKEILQKAFIGGERPSIETFLHSVSGKYTLHSHPMVVNVLTCRRGGMEILKELFPEAVMVPYATPGMGLAMEYFKMRKEGGGRDRDVVFLQNHGLVVSSDTAEGIMEKTEFVVGKIEKYLKCDLKAYHKSTEIWRYFPEKVVWKVTDYHVLSVYCEMGCMWEYNICPDCVVFLGKKPLRLTHGRWDEEIKEFRILYGDPVVVLCENDIYLLADSVNKAMEIQSVLSFSARVMSLNRGEDCSLLPEKEQDFLLGWDAEKFRKNR